MTCMHRVCKQAQHNVIMLSVDCMFCRKTGKMYKVNLWFRERH